MASAPLCLSSHLRASLLPPSSDASRLGENSNSDGRSSANYKWRMVIAYDGGKFKGWQYQPAPTPTIQWHIEEALIRITKLDRSHLCLVGAGRTDAGVHALGQVAHFTTPFNYNTLDDFHAAANGLLPKQIRVKEISPAHPEFHARFNATSKVYQYKIYNEPVMDPLHRLYTFHSVYKLNPEAMREAAVYFVGKHDFSSFGNAPSRNDGTPNPVKEIFRFNINELGPILDLEVEGTGFLYRQVRNMVALLLQVGREALPPDIVPKLLEARDRKELAKFSLPAPPHGLCLKSVKYDPEKLKPPPGAPQTSFGRRHTISKCKLPFY